MVARIGIIPLNNLAELVARLRGDLEQVPRPPYIDLDGGPPPRDRRVSPILLNSVLAGRNERPLVT
jgi:hypothetical protein